MQFSVNVFLNQLKVSYCKALDRFVCLQGKKGKHFQAKMVYTNVTTRFIVEGSVNFSAYLL